MEKTEFLVNQELLKEVKLNPTKENKTNYFMGLYEGYLNLSMVSLLNLIDKCLFMTLNGSKDIFEDMYFRLISETDSLFHILKELTKEAVANDLNLDDIWEMDDLYQYEISCKENNYNVKTGFVRLKYLLEALDIRGLKDCYTLTKKENIDVDFDTNKIKKKFENQPRVLKK